MSQGRPVRSMTGFARVRRPLRDFEVVITLKSVNHRALDLHFQSPPEFDPFEVNLRSILKRGLLRGHISVRIGIEKNGSRSALSLDADRVAAVMNAFQQAKDRFGLTGEPDLNTFFRIPGVLADSAAIELNTSDEAAILAVMDEAVAQLNASREKEGKELLAVLRKHNETIAAAAARIASLRGEAAAYLQSKLQDRLSELMANISIPLEPQRLAQEVAMITDRSDIGEEITRLQIHTRQMNEIFDQGGELGKKIDFLLQEMNRETNTILSKTSGIGESGFMITDAARETKSEIEKIREQALNLE